VSVNGQKGVGNACLRTANGKKQAAMKAKRASKAALMPERGIQKTPLNISV